MCTVENIIPWLCPTDFVRLRYGSCYSSFFSSQPYPYQGTKPSSDLDTPLTLRINLPLGKFRT